MTSPSDLRTQASQARNADLRPPLAHPAATTHKDRLRAEIDYQVNLKNELALNEILERLRALEHKDPEQTVDEYDVTKVNNPASPTLGHL